MARLRENTAVPNPLGWNVKFSAADLYRQRISIYQFFSPIHFSLINIFLCFLFLFLGKPFFLLNPVLNGLGLDPIVMENIRRVCK